MGSENSLWKTFKRNMKVHGEFDRHEDMLNVGVPDVSYVLFNGGGGWIELKHAHKPPVRPTTIFSIKHYTPEQRYWLRRRGQAGDNCWLLLQVDRSYWLFDWEGAQVINTLPYIETTRFAVRGWENMVEWDSLAGILRDGAYD